MSDQDDNPYLQSRSALVDRIFSALGEHEEIVFRIGYDQGFNAGWDAAVRRLNAMASEKPSPDGATKSEFLFPTFALLGDTGDLSAKDLVLTLIREKPGLRGFEIVDAIEKSGTPVHERTVRTALYRLKNAKQIKSVDNRWYLMEHETEKTESDDG